MQTRVERGQVCGDDVLVAADLSDGRGTWDRAWITLGPGRRLAEVHARSFGHPGLSPALPVTSDHTSDPSAGMGTIQQSATVAPVDVLMQLLRFVDQVVEACNAHTLTVGVESCELTGLCWGERCPAAND